MDYQSLIDEVKNFTVSLPKTIEDFDKCIETVAKLQAYRDRVTALIVELLTQKHKTQEKQNIVEFQYETMYAQAIVQSDKASSDKRESEALIVTSSKKEEVLQRKNETLYVTTVVQQLNTVLENIESALQAINLQYKVAELSSRMTPSVYERR